MDGDKNHRVGWLLNHTTLREFEVPLLRDLGLEVFCPKRFPRNPANRSCTVSHEFDGALSLPDDELRTLNAFDFYSEPFTPEIRRIINARFGTLIVAYMFPMFEQVLAHFQGRILLRVFGSTSETDTFYSHAREVASPAFERALARVSDRFWFAQPYAHLAEIEPPIMQRRSVHLPLALPDRILRQQDTWVGSNSKVLFVCPEIEAFDESRRTYEAFKATFGDLGHVICGSQSRPYGDTAVVGKVDAETYDRLFKTCNVMFYQSRLPRHVHYHPLEAICYGMPLVYMQQGMLGQLTERKLPGACDTLREARDKVRRLVDGNDAGLAREIRESQREICRLFSKEHAAERWRREFLAGILAADIPAPTKSGRIAVLPVDGTTATNEECRRIATTLGRVGVPGRPSGALDGTLRCRVGTLEPWSVGMSTTTLTPFVWRQMSVEALRYAQRLSGYAQTLTPTVAVFPDDGVNDFMDCDAWVVVGDRCPIPIAPVKPYVFVVTSASDASFTPAEHRATASALQNAAAVVVSTRHQRDALVREYGLARDWFVLCDSNSIGDCLWETVRNIP